MQWIRLAETCIAEQRRCMAIKITIYGKITGKARPRHTSQGRVYTPKQTVDYEEMVRNAYISAGGMLISNTVPIMVCITAFYKKAKTNKMQHPTLKPDADNIAKIVCDALNGIAYHDDKQITRLIVDKVWAEDCIEKVVIEVEEFFYP